MGTVRKTITLTPQQDQWIKARIAAGGFTNDSEYIRDLIRRDQEQSPLPAPNIGRWKPRSGKVLRAA